MVVMADVRALGVFQERVKTLLGSFLEVMLSEITEAFKESLQLNMSMKHCEKCSLSNPPESIKQGTSVGQEVIEAALNQSDTPDRLCPPSVQQEAQDTSEAKREVEYDADVKPKENEECEPARTKSSDQELCCIQSQTPASLLEGGQGTSSDLRVRMRPCSVQLQKVNILERPSSQFYVCSFCSKIFMFRKTLRKHKHVHIIDRSYSCSQCHKSFNQRKTLFEHRKEHKKLLRCTQCGKKFKHWRNLFLHWSCHAGRNPIVCFRCGKCCKNVLNRKLPQLTITE